LDAHNKFFRLGLNSVAQSDAHLQMMEAALLTSRDAVLAITHSGKTRDPVETLAVAQKAGAKTIAITSNPRSPITKHSDVVLLTSSRETAFRNEALASRLAQMSIVDALYTQIHIRNRKRAVLAEKKIAAVIGQKQI
jgi:DNA-binding MurR/RpiR family transcriptional regulator